MLLFCSSVHATAGPSVLGASSAMRPSSAGIQVISVLVFLRLKSYLLQFDEFYDWSFRYDLFCVYYIMTYLPWWQHKADTKKVFILNFIKLSDSPILPDSARNDFRILPWEFSPNTSELIESQAQDDNGRGCRGCKERLKNTKISLKCRGLPLFGLLRGYFSFIPLRIDRIVAHWFDEIFIQCFM